METAAQKIFRKPLLGVDIFGHHFSIAMLVEGDI